MLQRFFVQTRRFDLAVYLFHRQAWERCAREEFGLLWHTYFFFLLVVVAQGHRKHIVTETVIARQASKICLRKDVCKAGSIDGLSLSVSLRRDRQELTHDSGVREECLVSRDFTGCRLRLTIHGRLLN